MRKNKKVIRSEISPAEKFRNTVMEVFNAYYKEMRYPHLKK